MTQQAGTAAVDDPAAGALVPGPGGFATSYQQTLSVLNHPVPRLSSGLRLHGEYQGSGFTEPRYIARRGDGQVVQLSLLLHLVAGAIDGRRSTEDIAHRVSGMYGRELSEENVRYLIERKLEVLGVTVPFGQPDDLVPDAPRSDLLLSLKGHRVLFDERRVARIARALSWLHWPPVVAVVLLAAVAMDVWLFGYFGAMTPVLEVLDQPVLLLAVFGLTVASLVFHEFGHASACRYGGAHPGCIGCGVFLIWPSLYTDVTDVYRIGRAGRIRTDLGGVYFNVVFMLGMAGCYFATGQPFFLSAVYLGHFEVLEQLMPAVRLDGYYIVGDLAGVPDLFGRIRPILLSMVPGRPVPAEAAGLKRSARVIVTVWVLTMVPLLVGDLGYALWNLPRILTTTLHSLVAQLTGTWSAFAAGQLAAGLVGVLGSLMLVCPLAGVGYLSVRLGGRLVRAAARTTRDDRRLRIGLGLLAAAGVVGLGLAWAGGITPGPLPAQPPIVPALQPGVPQVRPVVRVPHVGRVHEHARPLPARSAAATPHVNGPATPGAGAPAGGPTPAPQVAAPPAPAPTPAQSAAAPVASSRPARSAPPSRTPAAAASPSPVPTSSTLTPPATLSPVVGPSPSLTPGTPTAGPTTAAQP
ncbi:hypothetical protein ACIGXM_27690 [Kitasatospora sp. NPDC052896]|uniref:hypothetical protein n=1 Tax=Kitasatospora sp. NPDC052896 TaxID=3364061 RepID=UPI0037C6FC0E